MILTFIAIASPCFAESDLEDNISKYTDDPITKWDELGKDSPNISYVIVRSLSFTNPNNTENVYINSVVVGPGSDVGDIYNIHDPYGSNTTDDQDEDENDDTEEDPENENNE
jgi:hypothetical protein